MMHELLLLSSCNATFGSGFACCRAHDNTWEYMDLDGWICMGYEVMVINSKRRGQKNFQWASRRLRLTRLGLSIMGADRAPIRSITPGISLGNELPAEVRSMLFHGEITGHCQPWHEASMAQQEEIRPTAYTVHLTNPKKQTPPTDIISFDQENL